MKIQFKRGMIPLPENYATVKNPQTGDVKIGKVGFSFTTLIFNLLPPIFRRDWYNLICMIGADCIILFGAATLLHQPIDQIAQNYSGLTSIIWGFFYNQMYFRHLSNQGYVPVNQHSRDLLVRNRYIKS